MSFWHLVGYFISAKRNSLNSAFPQIFAIVIVLWSAQFLPLSPWLEVQILLFLSRGYSGVFPQKKKICLTPGWTLYRKVSRRFGGPYYQDGDVATFRVSCCDMAQAKRHHIVKKQSIIKREKTHFCLIFKGLSLVFCLHFRHETVSNICSQHYYRFLAYMFTVFTAAWGK